MFASITLYLIMLFLVVFSIGKVKKGQLFEKLGFTKISFKREIAFAIGFLVLMLAVSMCVEMVFYGLGMGPDVNKVSESIKGIDVGETVVILTMAAFVEEIFFRGYLQRKTGLIITAFIFAYFHIIYGSFSEVVGTFALGIVLGLEYKKTKNLFAPVLSHQLYNLTVILFMFI
jgi:hypothetical protein